MKKLILTADDFGLAEEINQGIEEVCLEGGVTHVSVLANGAAFPEAVQFLKEHPEISAGIHLNLTDGKPLCQADGLGPLLNPQGNFLGSHEKAAFAVLTHPRLLKPIEKEWRAQVERVLSSGIQLFQINCHGHLHGIPSLFDLVLKMVRDYRIPFVRVVAEWPGVQSLLASPGRWFLTCLLSSLFIVGNSRIKKENVSQANFCVGVFDSGHLSWKRFHQVLCELPEGLSEIICHPGRTSEGLKRRYPWNYHWDEEREWLKSTRLKEEIRRSPIRLVNFREAYDGQSV